MFGLGWAEILVAAVVGLIVIGPKELPGVFRKIGQFVGKAKAMARDFSRAMNDAADDAGVKDAMDSVNSVKDGVRSVSDPTTKWKDFVPGSETGRLSEERAKTLRKCMMPWLKERNSVLMRKRRSKRRARRSRNLRPLRNPQPQKSLPQKSLPLRNLRPLRSLRLRRRRRRLRNPRLKRPLPNLVK